MSNEKLKIKLENLPSSPGVYLFRNNKNKIIYIGKAKNLKNRVRSYFQSKRNLDPMKIRLVGNIDDVELLVTDNEIEALILEANLVREHKPRYNVDLKDDKHFPYIKVTINEPFPRVLIVRRLEKDGARYFGPFTNATGMRRTVRLLTRLFRIRSCNLTIPHPTGKEQKVCLDYQLGRCGGPCENFQSREDYAELVDSVLLFLCGKGETLEDKLRQKMDQCSALMEYEKAAETRDQIQALQSVHQRQKVDANQVVNRDVIAFAREARDMVAVVLQVREGILIGRQDFQLSSEPEERDEEFLEGFIKQYYNNQPNLPDELYLSLALPEENLISRWLTQKKADNDSGKKKVRIFSPQKGEKLKLVDMATANARLLLDELLIQKKGYKERITKSVQALQDDLHLTSSPRTIACVDISNTGETDAVGSLAYFENGQPLKKEYRHFKIKNVKGQDDFAMMREIVGRYFYRLGEEQKAPPDLLVVDGGKGQLSSVQKEIGSLGFTEQKIIGLAKKFEEIYFPDRKEPLSISRTSPGLILLKRVRDEAHRFAIEYNRKVRSKRTIKSELDALAGIGPKRREILLKHFGSVKNIKEATLEQLEAVKGLPKNVAKKVYDTFH
ncbi:MAG: excinuclease ABC subunit UvrC [Candidatus Zixiibacteriota bacterium]